MNDRTNATTDETSLATSLTPAAPDVNTWFTGLEPGRQAVLRDDKWMLASAAYEAGLAGHASSTPVETREPRQPWGYSFMCSNGDGTSSPDIVRGEIPSWKHDVRNIVPLYASEEEAANAPLEQANEDVRRLKILRTGYESRLTAFQKALDEAQSEVERLELASEMSKGDAERWQAFFSSDRFYVMGWSGFDCSAYPEAKVFHDHDPLENWLHFTLNVWDNHPAGNDKQGTHGRNLLLAYVEYRRKLLASAPKEVAAEG